MTGVTNRGSGMVRMDVGGSERTSGALFKRRGIASRVDTTRKKLILSYQISINKNIFMIIVR